MSKEKPRVTKTKSERRVSVQSPFHLYLGKENFIILGVAVVLTVLGFVLMGTGSWDSTESLVFAPIVLFVSYVVLIPLSMFFKKKKSEEPAQE